MNIPKNYENFSTAENFNLNILCENVNHELISWESWTDVHGVKFNFISYFSDSACL